MSPHLFNTYKPVGKNKLFQQGFSRGFSLIEMIIVFGIVALIAQISISTFVNVSNNQSLEKDVNYAVSMIERARTQTINAKNNSQFGIKFASSTITLFQGTTYNANSASNTVFALSSKVEIAAINLTGGVSQATFEFITGKSNATGTVKFRLKQDANSSSTIMLHKTGFAEIL